MISAKTLRTVRTVGIPTNRLYLIPNESRTDDLLSSRETGGELLHFLDVFFRDITIMFLVEWLGYFFSWPQNLKRAVLKCRLYHFHLLNITNASNNVFLSRDNVFQIQGNESQLNFPFHNRKTSFKKQNGGTSKSAWKTV